MKGDYNRYIAEYAQGELKDKYGHVSIDIKGGDITEIKEADEQADKKD